MNFSIASRFIAPRSRRIICRLHRWLEVSQLHARELPTGMLRT
jgi:hypothetical protein